MLYTHYYLSFFFFFNDTATTEIYTLSLHDALPICREQRAPRGERPGVRAPVEAGQQPGHGATGREDQLERVQVPVRGERSEEHTSELQSQSNLVCRLLLEKKKKEKRVRKGHLKAS